MWFRVDYHSGVPIYEQIKERIKEAILKGEFDDSNPVPSVRELAKALGVNVNTVVRAYQELEMEGFLRAQPGVGYFVGDVERLREKILCDKLQQLSLLLKELRDLGFSKEDALRILEDAWRGEVR
ncbi:MAG: hypothetical protein PWP37_1869 [Thermotogota bacterium]|nr:hypothetical protein [Thermotogota bacterium]